MNNYKLYNINFNKYHFGVINKAISNTFSFLYYYLNLFHIIKVEYI